MMNHEDDDDDVLLDWDEIDDVEEATPVPSPAPSTALVTKVDSIELPQAWAQTTTHIDEVRKARQSLNLKHGMFANVPMVCKGSDCPLFEVCTVAPSNHPVGQRCPIEIASIIELYDRYCNELGVGPEDYFDQSQVKDLVDCDIKLMRAQGQLAISADFIQQVVTAVDNKGVAHKKPELHKATEYEDKLIARKYRILNDLAATRNKKNRDKQLADPSSFASDLMRRAMKLGRITVIDQEETPPVTEAVVTNDSPQNEGES